MTPDQIDRALADWHERLRRIDDNLVALETSPTCMLLEQAGDDGLEGATRARVVPALAAMRELFSQRSLLDEVLSRATELRKGLNRLFPGDTPKDIERLLRGPSIALPPVETPLARRGLLDAAETTTSISPDQLLAAMVASFEQARDAVSAVDDSWSRLTQQADDAAAEADRLQAVASGLGQDETAPLGAVRAQLEAVRSKIARDPLGAAEGLAKDVSGRLGQVATQLTALQARHAQVVADLQRAHALLAEIRATHARSVEAHRRCSAEIAAGAPRPAPVDAGRVDGLEQWLVTLDTTMTEGRWPSAGVGATRWLAAGQELLADEEAVERTSGALLDHRDELLGRLLARRQQARALAARGRTLDPELEPAGARAEQLLKTVPVELGEADRAVAEYEARLRQPR